MRKDCVSILGFPIASCFPVCRNSLWHWYRAYVSWNRCMPVQHLQEHLIVCILLLNHILVQVQLRQKHYAPQVWPNWDMNAWPSDHEQSISWPRVAAVLTTRVSLSPFYCQNIASHMKVSKLIIESAMFITLNYIIVIWEHKHLFS